MKQLILSLCTLFTFSVLSAQDVDLKKTSIFINGVEELTRDKCSIAVDNTTCVVSSAKTQMPLFSIHIIRYEEVGKPLMDISFVDFDLKCRSTMTLKDLYRNLYKFGVIDDKGKVIQEKAEAFKRLFNEKKN